MTLHLFNTETRRVEAFDPLDPDLVRVYACGPTIYGHAHIGNFRTFVFYDLVHRALEWLGWNVRFVMNLTDVDDKTIRSAREAGVTLEEWTAPFAESVLADADALAIRGFDAYPRATSHVDDMIELVSRLLEREMAYTTDDGSVYFDISAFPDYGRLSGRDLDQGRPGERVLDDEHDKEDARDFALWKGAKPEDETVGAVWDAPWGRGRPGWHLECSAMSMAELGPTLDLHLGGEDLIFPHHEGEIAQSEGATGAPFVRMWLHSKHLRVEDEKMSKSIGNIVTVRELLDDGIEPAALRHQLLSAHYRTELNFSREGLVASARAVQRLARFRTRLEESAAGGEPDSADLAPDPEAPLVVAAREAEAEFRAALEDDLNVSGAMAAVFILVKKGNPLIPEAAPAAAASALSVFDHLDEVLGLMEAAGMRGEGRDDVGAAPPTAEEEAFGTWVEERIRERAAAREARDWERADAIRDELIREDVVLEDGPEGTRWTLASSG